MHVGLIAHLSNEVKFCILLCYISLYEKGQDLNTYTCIRQWLN